MARASLRTLLLLASVLTTRAIFAANYTWTGAVNNNWNTDGNWDIPGFPQLTGDVAIFDTLPTVGTTTVTISSPISLNTINCTFPEASRILEIAGSAITFDNGGAVDTTGIGGGGSNLVTFQVPIIIDTLFNFTFPGATTQVENVISETTLNSGINLSGAGSFAFFNNISSNTYTGTTAVSSGSVALLNGPGIDAIPGDLTITSSGQVSFFTLDAQIGDTSVVTVDGAGAGFSLSGAVETVDSLIFQQGVVDGGGGTLNLQSTSDALTMRDVTLTTITIGLTGGSGGNVVFDTTNGNTAVFDSASVLDLGGLVRTFNIPHGDTTPDMDIQGVIQSTTSGGGINKIANGDLRFSNTGNTYNGNTTVAAGSLIAFGANTLSPNSNHFLTGGTLSLAGAQTIPSLTFNSGTLDQAGNTLSLSSNTTALTMRNTTISGPVSLTGTGSVAYDNTVAGTATISGAFDLGASTHIFDIAHNGANTIDMNISGSIGSSGGGINKQNTGVLDLSGAGNNGSFPVTLNAGVMRLNKTAATALAGSVTINAATLSLLQANQTDGSTSTISMPNAGAQFLMNGNDTSISSLTFDAGTVTPAGGNLTLGTLTMKNTTISAPGTITLTGSGSDVIFDGTTGQATIASDIDMNALLHTFNIARADTPIDMHVSGDISGVQISKTNSGILALSGNNTLSVIRVMAGTVQGDTNGLQGSLINDTQLIFDQTTSGVSIGNGTFAGDISGAGSVTKQNAAAVTLTNSTSNVYSGATSITGGTWQAGALDVFSSSSAHTVGSLGTLNLSTFSQTIGSLAGSGAVQIGAGATLTTGSLGTTTFSGAITGAGNLTKVGGTNFILSGGANVIAGTTTVSAGRLSINGALTSTTATNVSGTLGGSGTLTSNLTTIQSGGTLAPGNSIDTITIVGPVVQANGSTLEIEVTPTTNDLLHIIGGTGSYTIEPGATLLIIPSAGVYPSNFMATIVDAPNGTLTGTFTNVIITLPTFSATVTYNSPLGDVILASISTLPFSTVVTGGNAGQVARCIDTLTGGDATLVAAELRMIPTLEELTATLEVLQPSQFTALALAQQNATLYTNDTIFQRLQQETRLCPVPCKRAPAKVAKAHAPEKKRFFRRTPHQAPPEPVEEPLHDCPAEKNRAFWIAPFGALAGQHGKDSEPGYTTGTGGVATGIDFNPASHWTFGGALGYSYVHLNWKESRGHSNMQNGYGALYAAVTGRYAYLMGSVMGSYNHYDTSRNIEIGEGLVTSIHRHANGHHAGWQGSGHMQTGLLFGKNIQFSPFAQADYIFTHENSFTEHGAQSLDLHVESKNSDFLEAEAGIQLSRCFTMSRHSVSPFIAISGIRECRFTGKRYKSSFEGSSCVMNTTGMNPDRSLISGAAGLTILMPNENCTLSLDYKGKWGDHFHDNRVLAQFLFRF